MYIKVLIDNVFEEADSSGYVYGVSNEEKRRFSYHSAIAEYKNERENFKVITSGHVYVINYNKDTYIEKQPLTYLEYQELKTALKNDKDN